VTPPVFALLLALTSDDRHGYALMDDVAELTAGTVTLGPGTLYRSLQRMLVDGLIEELTEAVPVSEDRRAERRRSYRITAAGREAVREQARRLRILTDAARKRGILDNTLAADHHARKDTQ